MRNLDASRICKGIQLQMTHMGRNIARGIIIMNRIAKGENVLIPHITVIQKDLPFQFRKSAVSSEDSITDDYQQSSRKSLKVTGNHLEKLIFH